MSLQSSFIGGYSNGSGLETDKKPFLLPDQAFQTLQNAYVWRDRVKKREGLKFLGRLRRVLTIAAMGNISAVGAGTFSFNIFTGLGLLATEPNAQIEPGNITNITITIGAPISQALTDTVGTGVLTITGAGPITSGYINYATGVLTLTFSGAALASAALITAAYYPCFPVMGISQQEVPAINDETTIFFDQKYAYVFSGNSFIELPSTAPTTWDAQDFNFFWTANYRGVTPDVRLFFATNDRVTAANPIRYYDGVTWTTLQPLVDATNTLWQALLIIPYYGRLLALNTYEGLTASGIAGAKNFFARCRFSQVGDPTAADAWRSDQFGKGGFIDAPTNEAIVSATFFKNTLVVGFEKSTWQLRYVGEYGLPFIWERISSDFGTESTFSSVIFDEGVLSVADKGIVSSNSITVKRIDEVIPDLVYEFKNEQQGTDRIWGVRDFQKEVVYWNYADANFLTAGTTSTKKKYPNRVLVYNYRNNTFAIFRDNVTAFGTFQLKNNVTWARTDILWGDYNQLWQDIDVVAFPAIVSGNQEGFVHFYSASQQVLDDPSLSIKNVTISGSTPTQTVSLTIINHNLENGDILYIQSMKYIDSVTHLPVTSSLNNSLFAVQVVDIDNVNLFKWITTVTPHQYVNKFAITPISGIYLGGGTATLFPRMDIQTKDFNPYQAQNMQMKLSSVGFLVDATQTGEFTVQLYINSSPAAIGNVITDNNETESYLPSPYFTSTSEYAWHMFYATSIAQYINLKITYDDDLMNTLSTHRQPFVLNAMNVFHRPGGKLIF